MIDSRELSRDEIEQVWEIDRSEVVEAVYYLEHGSLVLKPEYFDMHGWPPGEAEHYTPILVDCYERGGWFYGLFDGDRLIGVVVLENRLIGKNKDQLQLRFLHIDSAYRNKGLGKRLFDLASVEAQKRRARGLYISATPSEHTVNFYLRLGCQITAEPDPELFALEPEDIHLEYDLESRDESS